MKHEFFVYVVELSDDAGERQHPDLPNVYIGSTAKTPQERFDQAKQGVFSGDGWVEQYGVGLMPNLYERFNPIPGWRLVAECVEHCLAEDLQLRGYSVRGMPQNPVGIWREKGWL